MSKLSVVVAALVCWAVPAFADVIEASPPAPEPTPSGEVTGELFAEPPVRGPSMVAPQPGSVQDTTDETPPLTGGRVVGEALLGSLFAVGGAIGGGYAGAMIELSNGCNGEFCGLGGAILGGAVGLTLAAPLGVYLVGSSNGQTGSFGAALGGSVLGMLGGIVLVAATQEEAAAPLLVIGPVVGSMIGFNATRKYERPRYRKQWAPVANVSGGSSTFGIAGAF